MAIPVIDFFLNLLKESPALFLVFMVNIAIISYLAGYFVLYFMKKNHPERSVYFLFWKMKAGRKNSEIKTLEDVYGMVMDSLVKKGVISKKDGRGFKARNKAVSLVGDRQKEVVVRLFDMYEKKVYGNKLIQNEPGTASKILSDYLDS